MKTNPARIITSCLRSKFLYPRQILISSWLGEHSELQNQMLEDMLTLANSACLRYRTLTGTYVIRCFVHG